MAGMATVGAVVGNSLLGESIKNKKYTLSRESGEIAAYELAWDARPWVWINLTIASSLVDGIEIEPGERFSLIEALRFSEMKDVPRDNQDPRRGYIAAQMSDFGRLSGWGYGLCLASTGIFRAALVSPLRIVEASTHYEAYPEYFSSRWPIGTDAAIFDPDPGDSAPRTDLVLQNPTTVPIRLHFGVYDVSGSKLTSPDSELSGLTYKATFLDHVVRILRRRAKNQLNIIVPSQFFPQYIFGNRRVVVRSAFSSSVPNEISFSSNISPPTPVENDPDDNVVFERKLVINTGRGAEEYLEMFRSQYMPPP